jgi:hypothetical protein
VENRIGDQQRPPSSAKPVASREKRVVEAARCVPRLPPVVLRVARRLSRCCSSGECIGDQRCGARKPCTPAAGWEENQVGLSRERFFAPWLRFKSYKEMNVWLLDQCIAYAKTHKHPELRDRMVWSVFEDERGQLVPYAGHFDGFHAGPASVSRTCLVRFDSNKYSVAANRPGVRSSGAGHRA